MVSKTKIEKKLKRKTNPELVETIIKAKKNSKWLEVSHLISGPARKQISLNLDEIDRQVGDGEVAVVAGKVLGVGEVTKKFKLVALSFSQSAVEKLKKAGVEIKTIGEEIKSNPDAKGVKVLKNDK